MSHWTPDPNITSTSTEASRHPTRLVQMGVVEVAEEAVVQDELAGDPKSFLQTITLPVNQELEPSSSSADVQDAPEHVGGTPIHHKGRGRRIGWGDQIRLRGWLHLGDGWGES